MKQGKQVHPPIAEGRLTERLKQLKEQHGEELYYSRIRLPGQQGEAELIWREPKYADIEVYAARQSDDAIVANENLCRTLVVPECAADVDALVRYPMAVAKWATQVTPFFGGGAVVETFHL